MIKNIEKITIAPKSTTLTAKPIMKSDTPNTRGQINKKKNLLVTNNGLQVLKKTAKPKIA